MSKLLQNSINTKEERIIHLNLENKVLKAMNQHLNERTDQLKNENTKQHQIISDHKRLVQEMSEMLTVKNSYQYRFAEHTAKFKRERNKLLAEIEQLRIHANSENAKTRPKSMPAAPVEVKQNRHKLGFEPVPSPAGTPPIQTNYWGSEFSGSQFSIQTRHSSSPVRSKVRPHSSFAVKKAGSEPKISLAEKQVPEIQSTSQEWPMPGRSSKSPYIDKIKVFMALCAVARNKL
ncbi:uncharacterized protein LOC131685823 isoform X2 [Topomyia yanbarensis]|uniref:uncharacterized protein LOC131685823 isoform X2 n=1 Tax=Topomyia yanbarensis TaxID=2498891 RepID=UPI00273C53C1|nr:uncharacterized protein LOC131685823 isoform X2 [Topomyia yanbarensis]